MSLPEILNKMRPWEMWIYCNDNCNVVRTNGRSNRKAASQECELKLNKKQTKQAKNNNSNSNE